MESCRDLFALYRYNPEGKELEKLKDAIIRVDYEQYMSASYSVFPSKSDPVGSEMVSNTVENFDSMAGSYNMSTLERLSASSEESTAGYAILTTSEIIQNSSKLQDFVNWKSMKGYKVHLANEYEWGGGKGDVAAENIRNWLKDNYLEMDLKYVMLIGDPDPYDGNVPMKMLWPRNNASNFRENDDYIQSPSDLYYADLNGNWDLDGDGRYGEGDHDLAGIDINWDLYVGRIPFTETFPPLIQYYSR